MRKGHFFKKKALKISPPPPLSNFNPFCKCFASKKSFREQCFIIKHTVGLEYDLANITFKIKNF